MSLSKGSSDAFLDKVSGASLRYADAYEHEPDDSLLLVEVDNALLARIEKSSLGSDVRADDGEDGRGN